MSLQDDNGDGGYHSDWQTDKLGVKEVMWQMSLHTVTMCSFGRQLAELLPLLDGTVMADGGPLSLVVEFLPHFTSLYTSLDTDPSQNCSQVRTCQNPKHTSNYPFFPISTAETATLLFYSIPVLLRYN